MQVYFHVHGVSNYSTVTYMNASEVCTHFLFFQKETRRVYNILMNEDMEFSGWMIETGYVTQCNHCLCSETCHLFYCIEKIHVC